MSNPLTPSPRNLQYFMRSVYGNFNAYLAPSPQADAIREMTGRKTLMGSDMRALEALGYTFEQVVDPRMKI